MIVELPSHSNKILQILSFVDCAVDWSTLDYFARLATSKCKPVAVLQLSSALVTGQTRTNSHQLSSKSEPVQSQ